MISFFKKNHSFIILILTMIIGLYFRVQMVQQTEIASPIRADALDYYFAAHNLNQFGVYSKEIQTQEFSLHKAPRPDALRPPGYSLLILPLVEYPPSESMIKNIQYVQVLLSLLIIPIIFFALKPFLHPVLNLACAIAITISPHLITTNVYVLTETFFTFSISLIVLLFSRIALSISWKTVLILGSFIALSALIRPTTLYFTPLLIIFFFVYFPVKKSWVLSLVVILGFCLVYSPWYVRNQVSDIKHSRSLAIDTIHKGMYPGLRYKNDPRTFGFPNRYDPDWRKHSSSFDALSEELLRRFESDPAEYIRWYLVGKPLMFLSWDIIAGAGDVFIYPASKSPMDTDIAFLSIHKLSNLLHWPITILALVCLLFLWLPSVAKKVPKNNLLFYRLLAVLAIYFVAVHSVGTPLPRYSIPVRPVFFALSVVLIQLLIYGWRRNDMVIDQNKGLMDKPI